MALPPALVLNADYRPLSYFPLSLWSWEDTIHAVFRKRVDVVAEYEDVFVHSPSTKMRLPSVVVLRDYKPAKKQVSFTRFNIFLRDEFTCQYCQKQFAAKELTFDHVVPRCKGGKTSWVNVVAACQSCNTLKANRLDMRPMKKPIVPSVFQLQDAGRKFPPRHLHESWLDYCYWDSPLEA